jgi:hypothetical protein
MIRERIRATERVSSCDSANFLSLGFGSRAGFQIFERSTLETKHSRRSIVARPIDAEVVMMMMMASTAPDHISQAVQRSLRLTEAEVGDRSEVSLFLC